MPRAIPIVRRKKRERFRCENPCMPNNVFIRVESRYFAYDNNENNMKQYKINA